MLQRNVLRSENDYKSSIENSSNTSIHMINISDIRKNDQD